MPDEDVKDEIIVVRGVCGGCGQPRKVTAAGVVLLHRYKGTPCSGAGRPPTEPVEMAPAVPWEPQKHNRAGYVHGCRCGICKDAARQYGQELRAKHAIRLRDGAEITHGRSGYTNWGCRCGVCTKEHSLACKNSSDAWRKRNPEKVNKVNRQRYSNVQAATLSRAKRYGYQWTGAELEVASRNDLSSREAALLLGRSYASLIGVRHKLRDDPKTINVAGIARRSAGRR